MTWFCSWLSDVEADGSGPIREVSSTLCGLRMEESGEEREIKESEVRSQLHVTSHGRLLFRQKQSRQETWEGSPGGGEEPGHKSTKSGS